VGKGRRLPEESLSATLRGKCNSPKGISLATQKANSHCYLKSLADARRFCFSTSRNCKGAMLITFTLLDLAVAQSAYEGPRVQKGLRCQMEPKGKTDLERINLPKWNQGLVVKNGGTDSAESKEAAS
jgi:hypothetical protein